MQASSLTLAAPLVPTHAVRRTGALVGLAVALLATVLLCVGLGSVAISPAQTVSILLERFGGSAVADYSEQQALVLLHIRMPRVLLGALVGAALAVSGALMQGLFRNPLADPGLVGVSAGSALAAVAWIVLGGALVLPPVVAANALALAAFGGGLATTALVYRFATHGGRTLVATMLLAGVAVSALAGAGVGLFVFLANDAQLRTITFWTLGALGGASWETLAGVAPLLLAPVIAGPLLARGLNAMLLGEAEAFHVGVRVERLKRSAVVLAALGVGASVASGGMIGFVGLVVPHLVRLALGPDHRTLVPASALLGGILLLLADLFARTIAAPAEVPIGIVTALGGAPFFLWLLLREKPT
ncbi:MAG TPA: iron ABC transporter permease [Rhodothermales bacterium]|nr:iron ABC transporter permease [Rhodothermales bacterium]